MRMAFSEKPSIPRHILQTKLNANIQIQPRTIPSDRVLSRELVEPKILNKVLEVPKISYGMLRNLENARSCCSGAK